MKYFLLILFLSTLSVYTYDRDAVKAYAKKYWNSPNHKCGSNYLSCSPWSYFGREHCGYESHGGDCANFVSQCLLAGGHPKLKGGVCRGYPCGKEEPGAFKLGKCLRETFGWKRTCGYKQAPPSGVQPGDVLVYHEKSCTDFNAHVVVVIEGGSSPKIACHSSNKWGASYTYLANSKPYYEWLLHPDSSDPSDPEPDEPKVDGVIKMVIVTASSVNKRSGPGTNYNYLGRYYNGETFKVVEIIGEWYKDTEGNYVSSQYVSDLIGTVTASSLNVRESPSLSAKVITSIKNGATVTCLNQSNEWYYVKLESGTKGWCSGDYLKF